MVLHADTRAYHSWQDNENWRHQGLSLDPDIMHLRMLNRLRSLHGELCLAVASTGQHSVIENSWYDSSCRMQDRERFAF